VAGLDSSVEGDRGGGEGDCREAEACGDLEALLEFVSSFVVSGSNTGISKYDA
jgi:hypothetical protein